MSETAPHAPITSVCILGGGTAGWMTAAGLSSKLPGVRITLVESEQIGTVGVGEATLPHIRFFNQAIGIDEAEFMRATNATFKLGIEFRDWGRLGESYIHPFGSFGQPLGDTDFHQVWNALRLEGDSQSLFDHSYPVVAAREGRFHMPHEDHTRVESTFGYAYQFDSGLYAKFLRGFAEERGVTRIEGKVEDVDRDPETGRVTRLRLEDGREVGGELFIDCSGFRGLLIEQTLEAGYEDWREWLPADRAVAVASEVGEEILPFTRATAREAGWQWRIPLQHRTGNGYVYVSDFISDNAAEASLLGALDTPQRGEPKRLRFATGKRRKLWDSNVVAIGLSGGFLEPLESTSIHLIQHGITLLLELFPDMGFAESDRDEYNASMDLEFERIRDFLLLHYVATERDDTPLWRHFRNLELPESLQEKMEAWRRRGHVPTYEDGVFLPPSWIAVFAGQGVWPDGVDPRVRRHSLAELRSHAEGNARGIRKAVAGAPRHLDTIAATLSAKTASPLALSF